MIFTRYYSDYTKKFYDTPEACETAEHEYVMAAEAKKNEQAAMLEALNVAKANHAEAQEVAAAANKASHEAYNELMKLVRAYAAKYGTLPKEFSNLNVITELFSSNFWN